MNGLLGVLWSVRICLSGNADVGKLPSRQLFSPDCSNTKETIVGYMKPATMLTTRQTICGILS